MTDEQKRMLVDWMGECWHETSEETYSCRKCGMTRVEIYMIPYRQSENRTFTTPQDVFDLKDRLVEKGLWNEFVSKEYADYCYTTQLKFLGEFISQLFRCTDESGEPHFARLCCEFLEER